MLEGNATGDICVGMFEVKVKLANLAAPSQAEKASLLVDTGVTLSWIPRGVLPKLGAKPISRVAFSLADGREIERELTGILLAIDGKKAAVAAAFGEPGEGNLGATAPESLGFLVDPSSQKLLPRKLLSLRTKVLETHGVSEGEFGLRR